jgi:hypothetical protein
VSESTTGYCLYTYLKHQSVLWALEEQEHLPPELKDEAATLTAFTERATEQAVGLLEGLYNEILSGGNLASYRTERRSQRKTVREQWFVEGRLFRPKEKKARILWFLCLGCLRDKGPAATLLLKPAESGHVTAFDQFAAEFAANLALQSANARECFAHDRGFDSGVIVAAAGLEPAMKHADVVNVVRKQAEVFVREHREDFEEALEARDD